MSTNKEMAAKAFEEAKAAYIKLQQARRKLAEVERQHARSRSVQERVGNTNLALAALGETVEDQPSPEESIGNGQALRAGLLKVIEEREQIFGWKQRAYQSAVAQVVADAFEQVKLEYVEHAEALVELVCRMGDLSTWCRSAGAAALSLPADFMGQIYIPSPEFNRDELGVPRARGAYLNARSLPHFRAEISDLFSAEEMQMARGSFSIPMSEIPELPQTEAA
ncbi:MAG: hypothetical protein AAGI11_04375 [Pseudomonadota bacterium]